MTSEELKALYVKLSNSVEGSAYDLEYEFGFLDAIAYILSGEKPSAAANHRLHELLTRAGI